MAKVTVLVEFDFDTDEYKNWNSSNTVAVAQEIVEAALHGDADLPEHKLADNGVTVYCNAPGCVMPIGHLGECFG